MNQGRKIITNSFEKTQQLGFEFAKTLKAGDIVCLYGDLGAGKTTFVQGLAKGLGIESKIISPTFIIMRTYKVGSKKQEARSKVFYHVDLYRIEDNKEVEGLGLKEILEIKESIVVIEWPEKIEDILPSKRKNIYFEYIDDTDRNIVFE